MLKIRPLQLEMQQSHTAHRVTSELSFEAQKPMRPEPDFARSPSGIQLGKAFMPAAQDDNSEPGFFHYASRLCEQFENTSNPALRYLARCLASVFYWFGSLEEPTREGCAFDFLYSSKFQVCSYSIIGVHAIVATALANFEITSSTEDPPPYFLYAEVCFLCFYMLELILRGLVHRLHFFVNGQASWNIFDLFLIVTSAVDVSVAVFADNDAGANVSFMRVFRFFKIGKVMRTLKVIHHFKALRLILEMIRNCALSMFWGLLLLLFFLYMTALVFAQGVAGCVQERCLSGEAYDEMMADFGSVQQTMVTLYMAVTGGNDWGGYYQVAQELGNTYICSCSTPFSSCSHCLTLCCDGPGRAETNSRDQTDLAARRKDRDEPQSDPLQLERAHTIREKWFLTWVGFLSEEGTACFMLTSKNLVWPWPFKGNAGKVAKPMATYLRLIPNLDTLAQKMILRTHSFSKSFCGVQKW